MGVLSVCLLARPAAAIDLSINLGDRPFYDGPSYWDDGYEWVWVAGHWGPNHHWVHGHYARHGEFVKVHAHEHHHHHDNDHDHDHDGDRR